MAVAGLQGRGAHLGGHGAGEAGRAGGRTILPPAQTEVRLLLESTHCQIRILQIVKKNETKETGMVVEEEDR